jgi:uncharacterized protein
MNTSIHSGTALITGASSGIGVVYANRLARRGHDLILVDHYRLCAMASDISDIARSIEVLAADLGTWEGLRSVERVLATGASVTMLVNNAGMGATTPMHLACAACPGFAARGHGTIINIMSIATDQFNGIHVEATALLLAFSRSLHHELAPQGIRVQAVFHFRAAMVMSVTDIVGAALTELDSVRLWPPLAAHSPTDGPAMSAFVRRHDPAAPGVWHATGSAIPTSNIATEIRHVSLHRNEDCSPPSSGIGRRRAGHSLPPLLGRLCPNLAQSHPRTRPSCPRHRPGSTGLGKVGRMRWTP